MKYMLDGEPMLPKEHILTMQDLTCGHRKPLTLALQDLTRISVS